MSKILPVPKIPNPGELCDYRPISALPALSKALEVVMRDQMISFIDGSQLLSPYQSGSGSGHSTATALLKITNDIQQLVTLLLLLDFSKASDNDRHSLLLRNFSLYFKFGRTKVALVGSNLSDRYQCVSVGGILSELRLQGAWCRVMCWNFYSSRYLSTILLPRLTSVVFICTPTIIRAVSE
jgi:hypothetical protein